MWALRRSERRADCPARPRLQAVQTRGVGAVGKDMYIAPPLLLRGAAPTAVTCSYPCSVRAQSASMYLSDPAGYAFMLPTAAIVATTCQLSGIGGAALFSPIFLIAFPLLGEEYPLDSAGAAIASALLTEVFGFASGLSGYARRGLVAWPIALQFAVVSVPAAFIGALCAPLLASSPLLLRSLYALLMFGLSAFLILSPRPDEMQVPEECAVGSGGNDTELSLEAANGRVYTYRAPSTGDAASIGITVGGASLTGLLGVGVGEVVLPQLVRGCCMPLPIAAGTSVAVVVATAAAAAIVQFATLASLSSAAGASALSVVPWNLVKWTIPGVLIGGQLAPLIASRGVLSDEQIERVAAVLFASVGLAFVVASL